MRILTLCFVCLSAVSFFISCQKEIGWESENIIQEDSVFIKKIISFDTSLPAGLDTGIIYQYEYDQQKRVVELEVTEFDLPTKYEMYHRLFYNGNDTLPYKYVTTMNFSTDSVITFLTYSNGFVVKDSSAVYDNHVLTSKNTHFVTSLGGSRYQLLSYSDQTLFPGNQLIDSITFSRNVVGGNVISGLDTVWEAGVGLPLETVRYQNVFDDKKNPFSNLPVWYAGYYKNVIMETVSEGTNNALSYQVITDPGITETSNVSYTYDTNGFPLVARADGDLNKAIYIYVVL